MTAPLYFLHFDSGSAFHSSVFSRISPDTEPYVKKGFETSLGEVAGRLIFSGIKWAGRRGKSSAGGIQKGSAVTTSRRNACVHRRRLPGTPPRDSDEIRRKSVPDGHKQCGSGPEKALFQRVDNPPAGTVDLQIFSNPSKRVCKVSGSGRVPTWPTMPRLSIRS